MCWGVGKWWVRCGEKCVGVWGNVFGCGLGVSEVLEKMWGSVWGRCGKVLGKVWKSVGVWGNVGEDVGRSVGGVGKCVGVRERCREVLEKMWSGEVCWGVGGGVEKGWEGVGVWENVGGGVGNALGCGEGKGEM